MPFEILALPVISTALYSTSEFTFKSPRAPQQYACVICEGRYAWSVVPAVQICRVAPVIGARENGRCEVVTCWATSMVVRAEASRTLTPCLVHYDTDGERSVRRTRTYGANTSRRLIAKRHTISDQNGEVERAGPQWR